MQAERAKDTDMAARVNQGTAALEAGDLEQALIEFQAVISAFPDRPEGHNNLGALYASIGRHEQAEESFDRVLAILPGNGNVLFNRGLMRAHQRNFNGAILDFEAALAENPHDAELLNNLGVATYLAGSTDRARTYLEQALLEEPRHINALINLCDVLEAMGDSDEAIRRCQDHLVHGNHLPVRRRLMGLYLNRAAMDLIQAQEQGRALQVMEPDDDDVRTELDRIDRALPALQDKA